MSNFLVFGLIFQTKLIKMNIFKIPLIWSILLINFPKNLMNTSINEIICHMNNDEQNRMFYILDTIRHLMYDMFWIIDIVSTIVCNQMDQTKMYPMHICRSIRAIDRYIQTNNTIISVYVLKFNYARSSKYLLYVTYCPLCHSPV